MSEIDKGTFIREALADGKDSPLKTYRRLTVGQRGFGYFVLYEVLTMLLAPMPGGLGFFLRKKFYRLLFKKVGKGLIIGRNVSLRHPGNIVLGDNVTIDENCLIDARGAGDAGVELEDSVILNRGCMILAKNGPVRIARRTTVGSNSAIVSLSGVDIGEAVLLAGNCYLSAGSYNVDKGPSIIMDAGAYSTGPIRIGAGAWLGTGVIVLDGVSIGAGSVVGAAALVNKDVPDNGIAVGIPAKVVRDRRA
ncbi:MAG: acyltransferase, partial [Arenicellales bacterium]|jgi:acetyltransferase-like isoleucine patch superfamily enzyme